MSHREVPVKVNAWVDEGVVPLLEALTAMPTIITLDSCEDEDGKMRVSFAAHGGSESLIQAVKGMAHKLSGLDSSAVLSLEWSFGGNRPSAHLRCTRYDAPTVVQRLQPLDRLKQ
jgi:hypothetical protein